ncbi:MAG: TIGR04283 family arsenosugar biosynthesis glycosyltransferase [Hyphomonadaceae bacterium]|jgi:rSAM/selenodomain-associated transferase 2|nr:TIGR04283 family arsenosugar biosynthesis glycosyltransferase [Hyphomonadaceae bacterium]
MPGLSVIIPVRNGGPRLADCLAALVPGAVDGLLRQVVVVDGGSTDASVSLARDMGADVIETAPGRGAQLAAGVSGARHDWLLLLHADTVLDDGWVEAVRSHIDAHGPGRAGWFRLAFDEGGGPARRVAGLANWRAATSGLPYGDQGLVVHRSLLADVGGVRPLPLMEDVDLVRRIGRRRLAPLDAVAETSAAKYRARGWWLVPARNLLLLVLFFCGVPPERLARLYR